MTTESKRNLTMTTRKSRSTIGGAALAAALLAAACSSSSNSSADAGSGGTMMGTGGATTGSGGAPGTGGGSGGATPADGGGDVSGGDGGIPAAPTLGKQIDRMGRPAINTAITAPFAAAATHDMNQDMYNAATPSTAMSFEAAFEANLAILDSLDRNCGNQFAADKTKTDATRYKPLADVLLDDQLYVDTSSATCAVYLGVEANATHIIPNTDCGGRTLTEDVADVSYSVLATGMVSGVTDGVNADDKTTSATFPFLAAPN
jgi:Domain of unknown function (DUF4331)